MKKLIISLIFACVSINAHAGFAVGYIMGSANNHNSTDNTKQNIIMSDNHDVIVCVAYSYDLTRCMPGRGTWAESSVLTPAQYAKKHGYNIIYKVGYDTTNDLIIMEVSK